MKTWVLVGILAIVLYFAWNTREHLEVPVSTPTPTGTDGGPNVDIDPTCPAGSDLDAKWRCVVRQTTEVLPTCPSGYVLTAGIRCRKVGGTDEIDPTCSDGRVLDDGSAGGGWGCKKFATPICPSSYTVVPWGNSTGSRCRPNAASTSESSSAAAAPGSAMTSGGSGAGNTTGGSSTSAFGPTSGGRAGSKYLVWGPIAGERDPNGGVSPADTSKTNKYPELLGGLGMGGDKTRVDGVGLTEPSSSWKLSLSGLLPDAKGLGSDEDSKYLPSSRTPGDMEKIPDPYRVSKTFTTSSYGSKTEPVPFLTDFSAFQK